MSTHNIGFHGESTKIIFQLSSNQISSNTHLIYSHVSIASHTSPTSRKLGKTKVPYSLYLAHLLQ